MLREERSREGWGGEEKRRVGRREEGKGGEGRGQ